MPAGCKATPATQPQSSRQRRPGFGNDLWLSLSLELYGYVFAIGRSFHFKELPRLEAEHARNDIGREGLDAGVEVPYHGVVVAPRVLDIVFDRVQRILQPRKLLRRFQFRIIL